MWRADKRGSFEKEWKEEGLTLELIKLLFSLDQVEEQ